MKHIIQTILEFLTKLYLKKNIKLIVVTGSVGKTSTKLAIASVLSQKYKVRVEPSNHNTHLSVPPALLGVQYPDSVSSPIAWTKTFVAMIAKITRPADVDVIIQELGTDTPGDIPHFGTYLKPDIAVVTAVSPEHMEFFKTLEAVAKEELSVAAYSTLTIINRDDIDESYAPLAETQTIDTYGISGVAEYRYIIEDVEYGVGYRGKLISPEYGEQSVVVKLVGEHNIKSVVAAACVGVKLGLDQAQLVAGIESVTPALGRMNLLRGVEDSTIIDDTYNASPLAVSAAIKTLYSFPAPQRIAILGSMNELGESSEAAHTAMGMLCDPLVLDFVVTIGDDARKFTAPAAVSKGCQVRSFDSPYEAGSFVHSILQPKAVVLAKGSQNKVFAEEAIKLLLHSTEDESKLVRQSQEWKAKKQKQFGDAPIVVI